MASAFPLPDSCRMSAFLTATLSAGTEAALTARETNMLRMVFQYTGSSRWSVSSGSTFLLSGAAVLLLPGQYAAGVYMSEETCFSLLSISGALPDSALLFTPRQLSSVDTEKVLRLAGRPDALERSCGQEKWRELAARALSSAGEDTESGSAEIPACIRAMKEIIDTQYGCDVSLDSLSTRLGRSKYYLSHLFRACYGTTPGAYLSAVRMESAERLLRQTKLNVGEIGKRVGLENPPYFISLFKKRFGMTPQQYRIVKHDLHFNIESPLPGSTRSSGEG